VESQLGQLIGQSGKLRMLSHQAVMFLLLRDSAPDRDHITKRLSAILAEFSEICVTLESPSKSSALDRPAAEALTESGAIQADHLRLLDQFKSSLRRLTQSQKCSAQDLSQLGDFVAGPLLAALNEINGGIGRCLGDVAAERSAAKAPLLLAVTKSVGQIERLSKSLQIVATNASLEAKRAGDAGRAFGIIADEMRNLSHQSRQQAETLAGHMEQVD
ncbi:MAG: methyl-accepting chemotaxis protein, partial [Mangrovicoccus sp.]